ncbi:alpha/beta-hydrolase [Setomelanomma holmii]|uniref:Alpha/beta-hydrolase n=1 Tax=Setomelanomma holmii TaxID=210430 RepID=A0A9P4LKT5_9PLEO|nr:alpha/beta-hydrolase [Setomelanomma holmii]
MLDGGHRLRDLEPVNSGRISSFADIPSSADLHWTRCYNRFHCANLEVPLDYENKTLGSTVVAWIRQEAANSTSIDLLFNPGGPGGSGINYLLSGGGDKIMKATGNKYNVVSFDPRGVNASGIDLTCFPGQPDVRDAYASSSGGYSTEQEKYAEAVAHGKWCTAANNKTAVRHAGTVAVVQDMIHFTELQAGLNDKKPEDAQIWYYGVSYGTVIGQTLAALYPDRLGRAIVDANVNGEDHYNGVTDTAVEDADDGMLYFFKTCYEAGPKKCAFAGKSGDAKDIGKRFNALLAKLEKEPLQAVLPQYVVPSIITKDRVLNQLFGGLYAPSYYFSYMAIGLDALEKGNATTWFEIEKATSSKSNPGPFNYTSNAAQEVLHLVTAIDAAGRYPIKNVDDYTKAVDEIEKTSQWFGEGYAGLNPLSNAGMNIIPPKSQLFTGFKKTKTRVPVLFVNTNADPITPLASAKHMSQYFEGSVVLVQNSGGHSYTNIPSKCTVGHVREYLASGKVPKDGTVCETDKKPLVDDLSSLSKRGLGVVERWGRR